MLFPISELSFLIFSNEADIVKLFLPGDFLFQYGELIQYRLRILGAKDAPPRPTRWGQGAIAAAPKGSHNRSIMKLQSTGSFRSGMESLRG
jgi:hypothetical protein